MALGLSNLLGLTGSGSWKDNYLKASFRKVEFYVETVSSSGGRRVVQHVFPERDDSYNEDLGRKTKTFTVSAYVLGDEYIKGKGDLEQALEEKGSGILVHPYRGEIEVKVDSYTISETQDEGRMCRFDINFIFDSTVSLTFAGEGAFDKLEQEKAKFLNKALTLAAKVYNVANQPNAILDDINSVLQVGLTVIDSSKAVMNVDNIFAQKLKVFESNLATLLVSPALLVEEIQDLIDYGTDLSNSDLTDYTTEELAKEQYNGLKAVSDFQDTNYSKYPSITNVDGHPTKEIAKYISRCAMGSRAGLIATMQIDHAREATGIAKEFGDMLSAIEQDETVDDGLFEAARDLRVAIRDMIAERKLSLAELVQIERVEFEPGIKLSYELYNDSTRDLEIARLNSILHPGFIPGGRSLDVEDS